jgi:hypothetical protein
MTKQTLFRIAAVVTLGAAVAACGSGSDDPAPPVPAPAPAPSPAPSPAPPPPPAGPTVARIEISPTRLSLLPGGSVELSAVVRDAAGNPITTGFTLTWQSSNAAVVSIAGSTATAVGLGSAEITAVANATRSAAVPVRVAAAASGSQLIGAALAAGRIDTNTALKYRVFALFNDPRLPFEFVGNTSRRSAGTTMAELGREFDQLSAADKADVARYFIPPIYASSWFYQKTPLAVTASAASGGRVRALAARPCEAGDVFVGQDWKSEDSTLFRVWYLHNRYPTDVELARKVIAAAATVRGVLAGAGLRTPVSDAVDPAAAACNGGDGRIDIFLMPGEDVSVSGAYGVTDRAIRDLSARSGFMMLNRDDVGRAATPTECAGPDCILKGTVAHEYMHLVQGAYARSLIGGIRWLLDATADWAINHVYPSNNFEHLQVPAFAADVQQPLWWPNAYGDGDGKMYGAWMFIEYLTRQANSPDVVRQIFEQQELPANTNALQSLNAAVGGALDSFWKDFAYKLWNDPAVDGASFHSWDNLTRIPLPVDRTIVGGFDALQMNRTYSALTDANNTPVSLPELSAKYERFVFNDEAVRTVVFSNGYSFKLDPVDATQVIGGGNVGPEVTIQLGKRPRMSALEADAFKGRAVTALIKVNGAWTVEDWSRRATRVLCRDKASERVQELILIFSNGRFSDADTTQIAARSLGAPGQLPTLLNASKAPCWQLAGQARTDVAVQNALDNYTMSAQMQGTLAGEVVEVVETINNVQTTRLNGIAFFRASGPERTWTINGIFGTCSPGFQFNDTIRDAAPRGGRIDVFPELLPGPGGQAAPADGAYLGASGLRWWTLVCAGGALKETPKMMALDPLRNFSVPGGAFDRIDFSNGALMQVTNLMAPLRLGGDFGSVPATYNWCFHARRDDAPNAPNLCPAIPGS